MPCPPLSKSSASIVTGTLPIAYGEPLYGCCPLGGASSSISDAVTVFVARPLDETANAALPFVESVSLAAEMNTDCGVFQFAGVNVSVDVSLVRSESPDCRAMLTSTFPVGAVESLTANPVLLFSGE